MLLKHILVEIVPKRLEHNCFQCKRNKVAPELEQCYSKSGTMLFPLTVEYHMQSYINFHSSKIRPPSANKFALGGLLSEPCNFILQVAKLPFAFCFPFISVKQIMYRHLTVESRLSLKISGNRSVNRSNTRKLQLSKLNGP